MQKVTTKYAEFWSPGFVFGASSIRDGVDSLDNIEWPDNAYAVTLHERDDVIDGDRVFKGEARQIGPLYYHPDSVVETLAQAKKNPMSTGILISNMEINGWDRIVWSRWGNWPQPFDDKKAVVLPRITALVET